jgi:putative chitinase
LLSNPEVLELPAAACRSAAWFWLSHHLSELADAGDFDRITRIINGGTNGQAERQAFHERALKVLGVES